MEHGTPPEHLHLRTKCYDPSVKTMIPRLMLFLVAGYAGACLLMFLFQRRMLYLPVREDPAGALQEARDRQLEPWRDEAGVILGWRARHPSGRTEGTLLVFHGNAGTALSRTYVRDAFQAPGMPLALEVVLLEYPGYGPRDGTPTEATILAAGTAAVDRLSQESAHPVYLLGESLGSAAAVLTAFRRPEAVKGLLLIAPLKSVPAIARRHYPLLPSFLVRDTFRADRALETLRLPIGFLVAGRDEVVFPDLGLQLYETYRGPKRLWVEEESTHNTLRFSSDLARWKEMLAAVAAGTQAR